MAALWIRLFVGHGYRDPNFRLLLVYLGLVDFVIDLLWIDDQALIN